MAATQFGKLKASNLPKILNENLESTDNRYSPSDSSILGTFPLTSKENLDKALKLSREGFEDWKNTPAPIRGRILRNFCQNLERDKNILADIVFQETGKSFEMAMGEVEAAIEMGYLMASQGRRLSGITTTSQQVGKVVKTIRVPVGICALIVASNTPIPNYAWKVFPALICGNSAILKPSEFTPFSATKFVELAHDSGIPENVLILLHGTGGSIGSALTSSPVNLVSFTGSREIGSEITKQSSKHLYNVALELGGNNPFIVLPDADIDSAVDSFIQSAYSNAGQRCAAASRLILHSDIYESFLSLLIPKINNLISGISHKSHLGPVISQQSFQKILKKLDKAVTNGNKILAMGSIENHKGNLIPAYLFENKSTNSVFFDEEIFGPIASVQKCESVEDCFKLANDSLYGLTAALWTNSISLALRAEQELQVGMVTINGNSFGAEPNFPFGGVKQSGNGWRENGENVIDIYTEIKTIVMNL